MSEPPLVTLTNCGPVQASAGIVRLSYTITLSQGTEWVKGFMYQYSGYAWEGRVRCINEWEVDPGVSMEPAKSRTPGGPGIQLDPRDGPLLLLGWKVRATVLRPTTPLRTSVQVCADFHPSLPPLAPRPDDAPEYAVAQEFGSYYAC